MRLQKTLLLSACVVAALSFTAANAGSIRGISDQGTIMLPTGKGIGRPAKPGELADGRQIQNYARPGGGGGNGINYGGGPVMTGTPTVYVIWYGNWSGNSALNLIPALLGSIGPSSYYNINTTYYSLSGGTKSFLSNSIHYGGSSNDAYSRGSALSDADIATIVQAKIAANAFPKDTNAVYMVLTSADVNETSGFCTQYCGWHTHGSILGSDIKYSVVGNPDRCPSSCAANVTVSPNSNVGADGMASIIAHELEETTSDPDLNAWADRRGAENADKCAWTFGTESTASNGSLYNMAIGGYNFLIQQNWVNAGGGFCAKSY
jgi:hypothetical protein